MVITNTASSLSSEEQHHRSSQDFASQVGNDTVSLAGSNISNVRPATPPRRRSDEVLSGHDTAAIPVSSTSPRYLDQLRDFILYADDVENDASSPPIAISERLSRLNITYLFNELIKIKKEITENPITDSQQMEKLNRLLHSYTEAVRDYEYMRQLPRTSAKRARDFRERLASAFPEIGAPARQPATYEPYKASYLTLNRTSKQDTDVIRKTLFCYLPAWFTWDRAERRERNMEFSAHTHLSPLSDKRAIRRDMLEGDHPVRYSQGLDVLARLLVALVGAFWLLGPFLIMAIDSSLRKTLVTVCLSVLLFALTISIVLRTTNQETVVATSTYAAVLVVFVGAGGGGGGSS